MKGNGRIWAAVLVLAVVTGWNTVMRIKDEGERRRDEGERMRVLVEEVRGLRLALESRGRSDDALAAQASELMERIQAEEYPYPAETDVSPDRIAFGSIGELSAPKATATPAAEKKESE